MYSSICVPASFALACFAAAQNAADTRASFHHIRTDHTLLFEANHGQVAAKYRFVARDRSGAFLLAGNEFVYGRGKDAVRVAFDGAEPSPRISGLDLQPGVVNYLLGNNSSKWIRNVPSYARVGVKKLYPGIDAVYYGSDGLLEIDFVVQSHINPALVRLRLEGGRGAPQIFCARTAPSFAVQPCPGFKDLILITEATASRISRPTGWPSHTQGGAANALSSSISTAFHAGVPVGPNHE